MPATPRPPQSRDDFRLAIICPLAVEAEVVKPLLGPVYKEISHRELGKVQGDLNSYTLGAIGPYNVVLVHMPTAGKAAASSVASHIKLSYPKVELAFLIGICGGVPRIDGSVATRRRTDIHLGDVIVSTGVVQYDLGRRQPGGFVRKDDLKTNLGRPGREIQAFLAKIETLGDELRNQQSLYLAAIQERVDAACPGSEHDILFREDYTHKKRGCQCAVSPPMDETVVARRRDDDDAVSPFVHFGILASGDTVMMSAKARDKIACDKGVIGFEMEGAGVWDNLPCILVKGVSDYADSHKGKDWQPFAAASAAACMRALLDRVPISLSTQPTVPSQNHTVPVRTNPRKRPAEDPDQATKKIEDDYLSLLDFARANFRVDGIPQAHRETCKWLVERPEYQSWANADDRTPHQGFFWIKGKPGAGKSTLMKYLLRNTKENNRDDIVLSFFFYAQGVKLERSTVGMYRSLLYQLLTSKDVSPETKEAYFETAAERRTENGNVDWSIRDLTDILRSAIQCMTDRRIVVLIDALDEADEDEIDNMISFLQSLRSSARERGVHLRVCLASRHYPRLNIDEAIELVLEYQPEHQSDLQKYVEASFKGGRSQKAQEIRKEICEKAKGVFLWVHLVVQSLNKVFEDGDLQMVRRRLNEIPSGLEELFIDLLRRDNKNIDDLIFCLQLALFSPRPLSSEEVYFAVLFANHGLVEIDPDYPTHSRVANYIVKVSKGLLELASLGTHGTSEGPFEARLSEARVTRSMAHTVYFIHESVRDFLLRRDGFDKLQANLGANTVGKSHEHIAQLCLRYICHVNGDEALREVLKKLSASSQTAPRQVLMKQKVPFLTYACSSVLYHANAAQAAGVSQAAFLEELSSELEAFIRVYNATEPRPKFQFWPADCLLYLLADRKMAELVKLQVSLNGYDWKQRIRHRSSMQNAVYSGDIATIRALLGCSSHTEKSINENPIDTEAIHLMKDHLVESRTRWPNTPYEEWLWQSAIDGGHPTLLNFLVLTREVDVVAAVDSAFYSKKVDLVKAVLDTWRSHPGTAREDWYRRFKPPKPYSKDGINLLLEYDCLDIHFLTASGQNAMHLAAIENDGATVKRLIDVGCNPAHRDEDGRDPLSLAAERGATESVRTLIKTASVQSDGKDEDGMTPLAFEAGNRFMRDRENEPAVFTLSRMVNINSKDNKQRTPLVWAILRAHEEVVEILLQSPLIEIDYKLPNGLTPLSIAAMKGRKEIIKMLLATGHANVNSQDSNGLTPLSIAAMKGSKGIVKMLLATGHANVNSQDSNGLTPLSIAAMQGSKEIIKMLLATGHANVNSQDSNGRTALSWAAGPCFPEGKHWRFKWIRDRMSAINALLDCPRIDPSVLDCFGHSPIWWAQTYYLLSETLRWGDCIRSVGVIETLALNVPHGCELDACLGHEKVAESYSSPGLRELVEPCGFRRRLSLENQLR